MQKATPFSSLNVFLSFPTSPEIQRTTHALCCFSTNCPSLRIQDDVFLILKVQMTYFPPFPLYITEINRKQVKRRRETQDSFVIRQKEYRKRDRAGVNWYVHKGNGEALSRQVPLLFTGFR